MGAAGSFLGRCHQEGQRDQDCGHGDHHPDDIDIGEQAGLDLGHAVDLCAGVVDGVGHGGAALHPCAGEAGAHLVERRIARCGLGHQHGEMLLAEARQQRGDEADADAAAEIAHERGESADLVVLFLRDSGVTERVDGDEQEGQAQRDEDAPADRHAEADVEIDRRSCARGRRW